MILLPFAWNKLGAAALDFLKVVWPILLIVIVSIYGANVLYYGPRIDNLKLEVSTTNKELSDARLVIEDQNKSITNLSETSTEVTREFLGELNDVLGRMTQENRRVIESILDAGVPEGCEESRNYLIRMIDKLQLEEAIP